MKKQKSYFTVENSVSLDDGAYRWKFDRKEEFSESSEIQLSEMSMASSLMQKFYEDDMSCLFSMSLILLLFITTIVLYATGTLDVWLEKSPLHYHKKNATANALAKDIPLRHLNPWPQFCPNATCERNYMCNPCGRRFIFLIEAVPMESATLLHMLNMLPDVQLLGDSYGLLLSLHEAHHSGEQKLSEKQLKSSSIGALDCAAQKYVEIVDSQSAYDHNADADTIMGFQISHLDEISASDDQNVDWSTIKSRIDYFTEAFPCSRLIVHYHFGLAHTKHEKLKHLERYLGPGRVLIVDPEPWTSQHLLLDEMAKWLGFIDCEYPTDAKNIKGSMYYSESDHSVLGRKCKYNSNG